MCAALEIRFAIATLTPNTVLFHKLFLARIALGMRAVVLFVIARETTVHVSHHLAVSFSFIFNLSYRSFSFHILLM